VRGPRSAVAVAALAMATLPSCAGPSRPAWTVRKRTVERAVDLSKDAPLERWTVEVALNEPAAATIDGVAASGELFVRAQIDAQGGAPATIGAAVSSSDGTWGGATKVVARPAEPGLLTLYAPFDTVRCGTPCVLACSLDMSLEEGAAATGTFVVELVLYGPRVPSGRVSRGPTPGLWIALEPAPPS
jgi:hypothetical protein